MPEQEITQEDLDEMQDLQEEAAEDVADDQQLTTAELAELYGSPEPEEKHNQHTFLAKSIEALDTTRVTYLDEWELGRPLFSLRFLLDMEDISKHYLDGMATTFKIDNKISDYFRQKIKNITDSGMSKGGFTANLNVTKKMDSVRQKVRVNNIDNLKGGKKRR